MKPLSSVIREHQPVRDPTPREQTIIDATLPLFQQWESGDLDTNSLFCSTSPLHRAVTAKYCFGVPSLRPMAQRVLDAMVQESQRRDHLLITDHGIFTSRELLDHNGRLTNGRIIFTDAPVVKRAKPVRDVPF